MLATTFTPQRGNKFYESELQPFIIALLYVDAARADIRPFPLPTIQEARVVGHVNRRYGNDAGIDSLKIN